LDISKSHLVASGAITTITTREKSMASDEENQHPEESLWQSIKDIVPIASVLTGSLWAASVFFGRLYYARYSSIMGVPLGLLSPSFDDYLLVGWAFAAVWLILTLLALLPASFFLLLLTALWHEFRASRSGKSMENYWTNIFHVPVSSFHKFTSFLFAVPIMGCLIVVFLFYSIRLSTNIVESGLFGPKTIGNFVFSKAEVLSKDPILPERFLSQPIRANTDDAYVYKNLYVATYDNGIYILFSKIDESTCRPSEIFVVYEKDISSISMSPESREAIPDACLTSQRENPTFSPTQIATTPVEGSSAP
jgi:hypothetical protein